MYQYPQETKANLEKTTTKLKEAREETEIIRKECQSIVKRYQVRPKMFLLVYPYFSLLDFHKYK